MVQSNLSIREIKESDFEGIVDYFLNAGHDFLLSMGVDSSKLPRKKDWLVLLSEEHKKQMDTKSLFYLIWLQDHEPVGHSNINKIIFGEEAYMHLHMWVPGIRKKGMGYEFMKMCLPYYFDYFRLKRLYCEPSALNPAANKTMVKLGCSFLKEHDTTPGWINFHQTVNRWCMDFEHLKICIVLKDKFKLRKFLKMLNWSTLIR